MSVTALTSAEISLPAEADGQRVSDRIAVLADTVDVVGLTDNHAGQPRMSPLAAVALAREQGVGTIVHVSCRDRNRLALQSQVVGAAALGAEGVLCMQGDPVAGVDHVADMTATELIARAPGWSVPHSLAVGAVVNPFAEDLDRELRLLQRKVAAGATFVQSQMVFDLPRLEAFLARGEDMLAGVRVSLVGLVAQLGRRPTQHLPVLRPEPLTRTHHRRVVDVRVGLAYRAQVMAGRQINAFGVREVFE